MVLVGIPTILHQGFEDKALGTSTLLSAVLVGVQRLEQAIDAGEEPIVDDLFVFQCFDLMLSVEALLMDLCLFGPDEGALVDIWVDLDVGIVRQLEGILGGGVSWLERCGMDHGTETGI